jgi:hypothetical protein
MNRGLGGPQRHAEKIISFINLGTDFKASNPCREGERKEKNGYLMLNLCTKKHISTYFPSSQVNFICGETFSFFRSTSKLSTIFFNNPSSHLFPTVDFIGRGPKRQTLEQIIKYLYALQRLNALLECEAASSYNLPDGFLEITPSTADFAVITGSLFAGNGSPFGVFC